eukprot:sb/3465632/
MMTKWETKPPSAVSIQTIPMTKVQLSNRSLLIEALTRSDDGEYSCSCGAKKVVITLKVVSDLKTKISVPEGYPALVSCGEGCRGDIEWTTRPSSAEILKNGSLWIESVSEKDQDGGPYSCTCDVINNYCGTPVYWPPDKMASPECPGKSGIILECGGETYTECHGTDHNDTSSGSEGNSNAIVAGDHEPTCTGNNCGYCQQNTLVCGMFGLFSVAVVAMVAGLFVRMRIRAAKMEIGSAGSPGVGTFRRKETNHYEEAIALPNLPPPGYHGNKHGYHGNNKQPPTKIEHGVVMAGVRAAKAALIRSKDFGSKEIAVSGASEGDGDGGVHAGTVTADYLPGEVLSYDENSSIEEEWSVRPDPPSNFADYYQGASEWSVFESQE